MHEVLINCLGGVSLPRKSVVRLTDYPAMTLDVYHGRKTTTTERGSILRAEMKITEVVWMLIKQLNTCL